MRLVTKWTSVGLLAAAVLSSGCARQCSYSYYPSPCHPVEPVAAVPAVTVLPIRSECCPELPWDVRQELTETLTFDLNQRGGVIARPCLEGQWQAALVDQNDLFSQDLAAYRKLSGSDIVVAADLMEYRCVPYQGQKVQPLYPKDGEIGSILMMKLRLRVVDISGDEPRILLQEVVRSNHMMRKREPFSDYHQKGYGSPLYAETPIGLAHGRLASDVAGRIQRYVGEVR